MWSRLLKSAEKLADKSVTRDNIDRDIFFL